MNIASPLRVTEENPSRSLLYGDEGIECCHGEVVNVVVNNAMKSTRYDWKSIPQYGECFVYRLNLISEKHAAWNSGETAYGVRPTDYLRCRPLNFFLKPSRVTGAKTVET